MPESTISPQSGTKNLCTGEPAAGGGRGPHLARGLDPHRHPHHRDGRAPPQSLPDLFSKITGAFLFRTFGGFLHVPTLQIFCLTGAIISETCISITNKYLNTMQDPPQ
jgi:hypothetical protein